MEMRFIRGSKSIMSPVFDEDPDSIYCMIEILSSIGTDNFTGFATEVTQHWISTERARYLFTLSHFLLPELSL